VDAGAGAGEFIFVAQRFYCGHIRKDGRCVAPLSASVDVDDQAGILAGEGCRRPVQGEKAGAEQACPTPDKGIANEPGKIA
jgi:hypothetical protein